MRLVCALVVAGLALTIVGSAGADPVQLIEAGGSHFPYRSYVLTLPKPGALPVSRLQVTENGEAVRGLSVTSAQAAKQRQFGVVLVIDASQSMKGKPIEAAVQAARTFASHRNPNQQIGVITFNDRVHVIRPMTSRNAAVTAALNSAPRLAYGTRIYDALQRADGMLTAANVQSGSIVLLSDGADVGSKSNPNAVLNALAKRHVRVFTVGLASKAFDPSALEAAATQTKGTFTKASGAAELAPIFDTLGYKLSREYVISYQSLAGPGKHERVVVKVAGLRGAASSDYVTPALNIAPAPPYKPSTGSKIMQSWITMLIVALLAAAAVGWAIVRVAEPRTGSLVERVGNFVSVRRASTEDEDGVARRRVDLLHGAEGTLEKLRWWPRFKATLELAEINASPTQIVLLTLLATAIVVMILFLLLGAFGFVLGLFTPLIARALIQAKLKRKRRKFADQLPDNLEVMAGALRAGHSLVGALAAVIESSPEPSQSEFRRVIAEEQLGVPLEEALATVVIRMDNRDLDQVALVARLQRETGAGAAEVIDRVIETVRARQELRRLVQTLTAQGRLSRWILTALPVLLALVLPLINPGYLDPLLHKTSGHALLVFTVLMVAGGSYAIGKIVDIKV